MVRIIEVILTQFILSSALTLSKTLVLTRFWALLLWSRIMKLISLDFKRYGGDAGTLIMFTGSTFRSSSFFVWDIRVAAFHKMLFLPLYQTSIEDLLVIPIASKNNALFTTNL
jgi:hypothetical protein